jgi:hypothetical protein
MHHEARNNKNRLAVSTSRRFGRDVACVPGMRDWLPDAGCSGARWQRLRATRWLLQRYGRAVPRERLRLHACAQAGNQNLLRPHGCPGDEILLQQTSIDKGTIQRIEAHANPLGDRAVGSEMPRRPVELGERRCGASRAAPRRLAAELAVLSFPVCLARSISVPS